MSDFAQLSAGDGTIFLVRWRGRQEGPYAGSAIAAKLAANEMGLLHEVYYEGKWITIRDYIALREAALGVEPPIQEINEHHATEEGALRLRDKPAPPPIQAIPEDEASDELLAARILVNSDAESVEDSRPAARGGRHGRLMVVLAIIFLVIIAILFLCWR